MTQPTIEEVAEWMRKTGLKLLATDEDAQGNEVLSRAAQVEAMGEPKTCDTCASYREYYEQVTNYNRLTNTCADGYVHGKGPKFGCIHHKPLPQQPPVKP